MNSNLNLLNFELPFAEKCKYVLTSPRSLKACRRAGIKPIELLYKTVSAVESEIGDKDNARIIYEAYEAERQRKLALCRALRNELLLNGDWSRPSPSSKIDYRKYSGKLQNIKTRQLPGIGGRPLEGRADTPENFRKPQVSPRTEMKLPKVTVMFDKTIEQNFNVDYANKENSVKNQSWGKNPQPTTPKRKILVRETTPLSETLTKDKKERLFTAYTDSEMSTSPKCIKDNKNVINYKSEPDKSPREIDSEDVNNNNIKITKKKRPSVSMRRKPNEKKKHWKTMEQKKALRNMKIQYSDPEYCILRYKQVIENSVERELREVEVQRSQRELELGLERWQDRVLLLGYLEAARAEEQASRELEAKVERVQQKSRAKNIIHTININKIKEAEDLKAEGLRKQVEEKKRKIHSLHQEKERIIHESKNRAISIQELKEHIRSIETPETFDQKVAKLNRNKKVLNSHMCPRTMMRSHIWLG